MRINQNVSALNAYRNMVMTDNRLNKSLERLSSGLRINRAADDAAGLAISEKMRGQIRGLNQAVRNAQDGITLIQTAEGALNETHSILQRMRELSVQSASDTLTSSDRVEIQKEINQLTSEVNRIANTTEFNTKKLLDGTTSALTSSDKLATKIFMRDGLRVIDQFGQKAVGGGNYKLNIDANPGTGQILKTDIMKIKHLGGTAEVETETQGSEPVNASYTLDFSGVDSGTFTLSFQAEGATSATVTSAITFATTAATLISNIETVLGNTAYSAADFSVTGDNINNITITFRGNLAATPVDLTIGTQSLQGAVTVSETETATAGEGAADSVFNVFVASGATAGTFGFTIESSALGANIVVTGIAFNAGTAAFASAVDAAIAGTVLEGNVTYQVTTGGQVGQDGDYQMTFDVAAIGNTVSVTTLTDTNAGIEVATATETAGTQGTAGIYDFTQNASAGTFTLTFDAGGGNAFTTDAIAFGAGSAAIKTELDARAASAGLNLTFTVSGGADAFKVTMAGGQAGLDVAAMTLDSSGLNPATLAAPAAETVGVAAVNEVQTITLENITDGTFTITYNTPEVQRIGLGGATGGTYTLGDGTTNTSALQDDASAGTIQSALEGLYGAGNVVVQSATGGFDVTFYNQTAAAGLVMAATGLSGASGAAISEQTAFATVTSSAIAFDASDDTVAGVLNTMLGAASSVTVSGANGGPFTVTFVGNNYGDSNVNQLVINDESLVKMGTIGDLAREETAIYDIDRFWDASGNFLVNDPQTITLIQGDGSKAAFTVFRNDTIGTVVSKINDAIKNDKTNNPGTIEVGKGLGQGVYAPDGAEFAYYVDEPNTVGGTFDTVQGTIVINSAMAGKAGEINFVGNDAVIQALSLTTIRQSSENQFTVDVYNAHSGAVVAENVTITGNMLVGTVHANVDVQFDSNANISVGWQAEVDGQAKADYTNQPKAFYFAKETNADGTAKSYETFVHLADNSMVFHIGANPLQDIGAAMGDMRAEALGIDNIIVTDRANANRAIAQLDGAIGRVSSERSKMGALQNRLEHTINNLGVSAENLTAAESRIRDLDFAMEMIEFTRNQIMMQAGTSMLAQANMKPQSVLMLLG